LSLNVLFFFENRWELKDNPIKPLKLLQWTWMIWSVHVTAEGRRPAARTVTPARVRPWSESGLLSRRSLAFLRAAFTFGSAAKREDETGWWSCQQLLHFCRHGLFLLNHFLAQFLADFLFDVKSRCYDNVDEPNV
jgi:hypothetical protein